jgi:hypothetical protein
MSRQELVDGYLKKWVSRKLVVFVVASVGLFSKVIDSGDWVIISTAYISIEGITSIVTKIYKSKTAA